MITGELFKERLRDFFSCWRISREELWGSSDIILVSTPPFQAQPNLRLRSLDFLLWLMGEDVKGITAVFTPSWIFFLCTSSESFSALHSLLRGYPMNIGVSVELIKPDEGVSKLDRIIIESRRRCRLSRCSSLRVGCIDWEWIMMVQSKVLDDFNYTIVDVDPGVQKLIGIGQEIDKSSRIYKDDILFGTYLLLTENATEAMNELENYNQSCVLKEMENIFNSSLGDDEAAGRTSNSNEDEANKLGIEIKQRLILLYSKWRKYRNELWGDSDVLVTCPELCVLGLYMATALEITVSVEPRRKANESQVLNSSTLYRDRGDDHPSPVIIGYIDGEAPNSKFLHIGGCVEYGRRFQATNVRSAFVKLLYEVVGEGLLLESLQTPPPPPPPPPPHACMFSSHQQTVEAGEAFEMRLRDFFSSWRMSHEELWGSSDIILVSTHKLQAQAHPNLRSRNFLLWLLGEDVAGTTAVFTRSRIFFLCNTPESFSALHNLRGYVTTMNIGVSVQLIKPKEGVSKLDRIIIESTRRCSFGCCSIIRVGCIDRGGWVGFMIIQSKVLDDFDQYKIVDVDPGVQKLIGIVDDETTTHKSSRIYKQDILLSTYLRLREDAIHAMDQLENYNQSSVLKEMKNIINSYLDDDDEAAGTSNSNSNEDEANKLGIEIKQRSILLYSKWRKCRKELWGDSDVLVTRPKLCVLGLYMAVALEIIVSVEPRRKANDDESQVLNSSTLYPHFDLHRDRGIPVIIGYIDGEVPNSKFLHTCGCVEYGKSFQATNVRSGFVKLLDDEVVGEWIIIEITSNSPSPPLHHKAESIKKEKCSIM
nr:FACT complex subunit SPT16-like [Ipomoea batatas]